MRTKFWASLLLLAASCTAASAATLTLPSGKRISYSAGSGCTRYIIPLAGKARSTLCLQRDASVAKDAAAKSIRLVAEVPNVALVVTETDASIPGGMSYCQAGEEVFLRVIALKGRQAKQTYQQKLASCRQDVELADPGLSWSPESRTLSIHWLSPPTGIPDSLTLHIDDSGEVIQP